MNKRLKRIHIDPPSGWKYGFPKEINIEDYESKDFNLDKWLLTNGYPKEEIEFSKYSRIIKEFYED